MFFVAPWSSLTARRPTILRRLCRQMRYLSPTEIGLLALVGWGYRLKIRKDGYVAKPPS
jgi:hypothetical protein